MHTFAPIVTSVRLSIQTFSPTHVCAPIESIHGYFTRIPDLRTTLCSTLAPKQRRIKRRTEENGKNSDLNKGNPMKSQSALTSLLRPGEYQELS